MPPMIARADHQKQPCTRNPQNESHRSLHSAGTTRLPPNRRPPALLRTHRCRCYHPNQTPSHPCQRTHRRGCLLIQRYPLNLLCRQYRPNRGHIGPVHTRYQRGKPRHRMGLHSCRLHIPSRLHMVGAATRRRCQRIGPQPCFRQKTRMIDHQRSLHIRSQCDRRRQHTNTRRRT